MTKTVDNSDFWFHLLQKNPDVLKDVWPSWSDYIPHDPSPTQLAFLLLPHREAFYGGAAGGGKSDALLMGALQYVDVPGYSAILFRRTLTDASRAGAILDRARSWLVDTPARWTGNEFVFPSGAKVAFGYLESDLDIYKYQGAEYQYIGFDELTQFYEDQYLYLHSRLRRTKGMQTSVPLRVRAASNPGGIGHAWVKSRFKIEYVPDIGIYRGTHPHRPHIPAFVADNPYLDQESYIESLKSLDPVTREQLLKGDWGVSADGRIRRAWIRRYSRRGDYVVLGPDGRGEPHHLRRCIKFATIDPAASTREGPGDAAIWRKEPSWSVMSTWVVTPDYHLIWWNCRRWQAEIPDLLRQLKLAYKEDQPEYMLVEANGLGIGVFQMLKRVGLPVRDVSPRAQDKLVRATPFIVRFEGGKVWLPEHAPWLDFVEEQLFTWTGHPKEPADIVDTAGYAGIHVNTLAGSQDDIDPLSGYMSGNDLPSHSAY